MGALRGRQSYPCLPVKRVPIEDRLCGRICTTIEAVVEEKWMPSRPQFRIRSGEVRVRTHHQKRAMVARRMAKRKTWAQRS